MWAAVETVPIRTTSTSARMGLSAFNSITLALYCYTIKRKKETGTTPSPQSHLDPYVLGLFVLFRAG
jgi:hypothetical protein